MRYVLLLILAGVAGLAAYLATAAVPFEPVAWTPPANPGQTGPFAANERLKGATLAAAGPGPEDVARGADGLLYAGLADGRIVRLKADGSTPPETVAETGGRPLGLHAAPDGLYVADAERGLLAVSLDGTVRTLTDAVDGARMVFVDDLDVAADGSIWFSDASARFGLSDNILDVWEGRATGRLLTYDPRSGDTKVQASGLRFANGVALGPNEDYVLVNETLGYRVTRLWLKGPKAGTRDVFIDSLPGFPDNISFDGRDTFWIALVAPRQDQLDALASRPTLRRMLYAALRLFGVAGPEPEPYGWIIGVGLDGRVKANLQDPSGRVHTVTSVNRYGDMLVLGSLTMDSIATIPAP